VALLVPKGKRNGENKRYLISKTIICLLDQFAVVQLGAKSYIKRDYGNEPAGGDDENKANQSQSVDAAPDETDFREHERLYR
jgi:hypothetical protein